MASPLQKAPNGLLGLFNLKTLGQNPSAFSDQVVPVADVNDFYGSPLLTSAEATAARLVTSGGVGLTVPPGQAWRVSAIGLVGALDAATTFTTPVMASLAISFNNIGVPIGPGFFATAASFSAIATAFRLGVLIRPSLVLPPGTSIQAVFDFSASANGITPFIRVLYEPLPL